MSKQRLTPADFPRFTKQEKEAMKKSNRRAMSKIKRKKLDGSKTGIKLVTEVW